MDCVNLLYIVVPWIGFEAFVAVWMFYDFKIKPWLKRRGRQLDLKEEGLNVVTDVHLYNGKTYAGSYDNLNITKLFDDFANKITGVLPKRDLESRLKDAIEVIVDKEIVEIVEDELDEDALRKHVRERLDSGLKDYFTKPEKK